MNSSIALAVLEKIIRIISGLTIGVLVVRHLGPSQYGELAAVLAIISILSVLVTFGLDGHTLSSCIKDEKSSNQIITVSILIRLLCSSIFILFIFGLYLYANTNRIFIFMLASPVLVLQSVNGINAFFHSTGKSIYVHISGISAQVAVAAYKLYGILTGWQLEYFVFSIIVEQSIYLLIILLLASSNSSFAFTKVTRKHFESAVKNGIPSLIAGLLVILYMKLPLLFIDYFMTSTQVGIFAATLSLIQPMHFIGNALVNSYASRFSLAKNEQYESASYIDKYLPLYKKALLVAVSVIVFINIFAELIIGILFGNNYADASALLRIMSFSLIFVYFGTIDSYVAISMNKVKLNVYRGLIGIVFSIALSSILALRFGLVGISLAVVFSYFAATTVINIFIEPKLFFLHIKSLALRK